MHFFISKKVIMKEIGETGIYCRMFKFNIDTSEAAADEMGIFSVYSKSFISRKNRQGIEYYCYYSPY